jgi:hypothetical protein
MGQKLATPEEQRVVGRHLRHVDPHPQYGKATDVAELRQQVAALGGGGAGTTLSDATPAVEHVSQAGSPGIATTASRGDHRHPMPGLATTAASGFMSAAHAQAIAAAVVGPAGGGVLDMDNGTLVFDVDTVEQVVAA